MFDEKTLAENPAPSVPLEQAQPEQTTHHHHGDEDDEDCTSPRTCCR